MFKALLLRSPLITLVQHMAEEHLKTIFNNEKYVIDLPQPFYEAIMLDKGFAIVEECKTKGIQLIRPPSTKGRCVPSRTPLTFEVAVVLKMSGYSCAMGPPLRDFEELKKKKFNDENENTVTSEDQLEVEKSVQEIFHNFNLRCEVDPNLPKLLRWEHIQTLKHWLMYLPPGYKCLDASRTWICYWILHSLSLLETRLSEDLKDALVDFLGRCQSKEGGFGGGPGQMPHLATTYAAINSLCIIGTKKAYDIINREALQRFLCEVKSPDGAFCMHRGGEVDIRGVYCALSVATLTNVFTEKLFEGTAEWVISCQTYEGGFSGCPGMEAHGGYAFCGLAALLLLNKGHLCDVDALLRWTVNRQMRFEGGFQGRTNKLVDGCYSFWQGGAFPLIHSLLVREGNEPDSLLFNQSALQEYILICCQCPAGGLLDKPGKPRDIYHTCYTLSGLSVAQHSVDGSLSITGPPENKLGKTHPIYNIGPQFVLRAGSHFSRFEVPQNVPSIS